MRLRLAHALLPCLIALTAALPPAAVATPCAVFDAFSGGLGRWSAVHGKPRVVRGALVTPRSRRPAWVERSPAAEPSVSFWYRRDGRGAQTLAQVAGVRVRDDGRGRLIAASGRTRVSLGRGSAGRGRKWRRVTVRVSRGRAVVSAAGRRRVLRTPAGSGTVRLGDLDRARSGPFRFDRVRVVSCPRWFAPDSFWNARLRNDAALDPKSDVWVAELQRQLTFADPWINTTTYSTPVYTVPADQPTVRVNLDGVTWKSPLQDSWERVPIPAGAKPAAGSDAHMVVWQPSTDRMWEFWAMSRKDDGWHARWGGTIEDVSRSPGHYAGSQARWGATATSLPLAGGLIRAEELRQGRIDHALALAIPHTLIWTEWSWPAQRSDGDTDSPSAIPEGARFRLDPSLEIDSLGLPRTTEIIAKAAQEHGIVLRDKSGAVSFYAEDPTPTGHDPYPALFGTWPNRLFDRFPWHRLQVLKTDMRSAG
jgi:hypothetical protein